MEQIHEKERKHANWLVLLLAASCGLVVANLYYTQPLVLPISKAIGISPQTSGLIVTLTQMGYVIGLLFLVPLSDLLENVRLAVSVLLITILGLLVAAFSDTPLPFLTAAFLIGLGSVAAQILVPYASYLAPPEKRGQMIGNVMSGLLLGIMLARPVSGMTADLWGWRTILLISAIIIAILLVLFLALLPRRKPISSASYQDILISLGHLFCTTPILRRRAIYQASLFGSFSLFWTVAPIWLAEHFLLTQMQIAIFALVGVGGALVAPIAGKLADKGYSRPLTGMACLLAAIALVITQVMTKHLHISLLLFVLAGILLDMAVSGNLIVGQQAIYGLGEAIRGRVNGIFMAVFFMGGAIGSGIGGWAYAVGGWRSASLLGLALPIVAYIYHRTEKIGLTMGKKFEHS